MNRIAMFFDPSRTLLVESVVIPEFQGHAALVAVKLEGREDVDGLFEYRLTLKTPDGLSF